MATCLLFWTFLMTFDFALLLLVFLVAQPLFLNLHWRARVTMIFIVAQPLYSRFLLAIFLLVDGVRRSYDTMEATTSATTTSRIGRKPASFIVNILTPSSHNNPQYRVA